MQQQTFTITYGDQAENHKGMEIIGTSAQQGFNLQDLQKAKEWFEKKGATCVLYNLRNLLPAEVPAEDAFILVIPRGVNRILRPTSSADQFFQELVALNWDAQALMYGRVVNKHARHNLCFDAVNQEPDYANGKGRIVNLQNVPLLNTVRKAFEEIVGEKGKNLVAEGNHYYDINVCGIGFHGDGERKIVIGVRLGATLPLHYQWFHNSQPIGQRGEVMLNHGDIYFMSEKAAGSDWKKRSMITLRHAAGAKKYLEIKRK